jgi:uncharacterized damage-inducible protein DinB
VTTPNASWTAPDVERTDPPRVAGERESLEAWLDYHRSTLLGKCAGLDRDQLRRRPVASSTLSLHGLVRHMAMVERWWFEVNARGRAVELPFWRKDNRDGDFDDVDGADAETDFAAYLRAVEDARAAVADLSLDHVFRTRRGNDMDLRWVYVHMIEEYARHNGHADLLREVVDGTTGD